MVMFQGSKQSVPGASRAFLANSRFVRVSSLPVGCQKIRSEFSLVRCSIKHRTFFKNGLTFRQQNSGKLHEVFVSFIIGTLICIH